MKRPLWKNLRRVPVLFHIIFLFCFMPALATALAVKWKDSDSTEQRFQIDAVGLLHPRLGRDSLSIEFSRFYRFGNLDVINRVTTSPQYTIDKYAWQEKIDSAFWREADAIGYKVIGPMERIATAVAHLRIDGRECQPGTGIVVASHTTAHYVCTATIIKR